VSMVDETAASPMSSPGSANAPPPPASGAGVRQASWRLR
jgi:hypothetical protein